MRWVIHRVYLCRLAIGMIVLSHNNVNLPIYLRLNAPNKTVAERQQAMTAQQRTHIPETV
jgi:hypothetical protein